MWNVIFNLKYERWQPRARYRQSLDPTVEEIRRLATGLRRNARDERVLFHYNGHGVPKPTGTTQVLTLIFVVQWSLFIYSKRPKTERSIRETEHKNVRLSNADIRVVQFVRFSFFALS